MASTDARARSRRGLLVLLILCPAGCRAERSEWFDALDEARALEATPGDGVPGGVDVAAVLGDRAAQMVSRHAHREWIEFLSRWGTRPLLVVAENSMRRVSPLIADPEQARFAAELLGVLERRRLLDEPPSESFRARATAFLDRDEAMNHYAMTIARWSLDLAEADSHSTPATPEQVGHAQGCVHNAAQLEFNLASPEEVEAFGEFLWPALVWDNLDECRPRIIATMKMSSPR